MTVAVLPASPAQTEHVTRGRAALLTRLPDVDFNALKWPTIALREKAGMQTPTLHFTRHGSQTAALPERYAAVVKAWVAQQRESPSRMAQRVTAARWLWRAIEERLGAEAEERFDWSDLQLVDLQRAEQLMIEDQCSQSTVNKTAGTMGDLARDLGKLGIAPPLVFRPTTKRYRDSNNHRVTDGESRDDGVLTRAALHAVADIFAHAATGADQLYSALITLMIATGVRWNEVLCIPLRALEDEEYDSRDVAGRVVRRSRTYLRFFKSKSQRAGGAGAPSLERVPLSTNQAALARLAVERLVALCAEARAVAAQLEGMGGRWRWTGAVRPTYVTAAEVADVLGCTRNNATYVLREHGDVDPAGSNSGPPSRRMHIEDFERYMSRRVAWERLWVVQPGATWHGLRASEALLCVRENELHSTRSTLPLIDEVSHAGLETWLDGNVEEGHLSVFRRHELERGVRYVEPDGRPVMINSHMCRRLFVTNAYTAGATTLDLMRWQGREHAGDLATYDRRSMLERATSIKADIRSGRLRGQVAQAFVQLADGERDEWLDGHVSALHVTPLGYCVHDFSVTPCPRALNCLKECPDYLHDPNDAGQRTQLVQLQRRTSAALESMQPEVAAGRIAPSWVDEHERTLRNVERILATPAAPDGAYVRPFADAPTVFQPLTPER